MGILAYNISEYNITKRTLFFINKGFEADVSIKIKKCEELVLYIVIIIEEIYKLQKKLRQDLIFFNRKIKEFTDRKRVRGLTLREKNKVYFL